MYIIYKDIYKKILRKLFSSTRYKKNRNKKKLQKLQSIRIHIKNSLNDFYNAIIII